jgi:dihydroxyacetone kinase/dihydroxyacetone kinase-like protein
VNELYVLYDRIEVGLEKAGLQVHRVFVGNYFTSLEMVGATLTVMALDDELKTLLDVSCASPGMTLSGNVTAPVGKISVRRHHGKASERVALSVPRASAPVGPEILDLTTASGIVEELAAVVVANKEHLSNIDGLIGDGDHGINMAKGFSRAAEQIVGQNVSLATAFDKLSDVLMSEIGGSMGPLYGFVFRNMALSIEGQDFIDAEGISAMLNAGLQGASATGGAKIGDKTLVDCFVPAVLAFDGTKDQGLVPALSAMGKAAETGRDSTIDLVAKLGRAARLGERSRGVPDAGATSCCLILNELAAAISRRLTAA